MIENKIPKSVRAKYNNDFKNLQKSPPNGFDVFQEFRHQNGAHPESSVDYQCAFASQNLSKTNPKKVLDIGSYRQFVIGLLSGYQVTTVDVRKRTPLTDNETVISQDAKELNLPDSSFDAVVSLCALEHFGLGRYGDDFDITADAKAIKEMIRVLRPGGVLIISTTITQAKPSICFNAHRIYNYKMIENFCTGLTMVEELIYSEKNNKPCIPEEITMEPEAFDVYCGCWVKK